VNKDDLSMLLTQSAPGDTVAIEEHKLRSIFGHGAHALDDRTLREAGQFAGEHNCELVFDASSRTATFRKRMTPRSRIPAGGA
jgi:hypothetical protein